MVRFGTKCLAIARDIARNKCKIKSVDSKCRRDLSPQWKFSQMHRTRGGLGLGTLFSSIFEDLKCRTHALLYFKTTLADHSQSI